MRRSCPSSSLVSLALLLLSGSSAALAQGVPDPRGPQFLLASASPTKAPVVVDAGSVAPLRRRVSLTLNGVRAGEALVDISRASGLQIVYADGVVPSETLVHFRAEEITVAAALTEVLLDAGVDVLITPGGSVVLVKRGAVQTGSVAGRVTDAKTGNGIANVSVSLQGTGWRSTTDPNGQYRMVDVAAGTYTLRVSRIGYAKQSQSVTVAPGREVTVDLALRVAATELEQVVVTGTVTPTEVRALPTPISIITADEIEQKGYQRVDQIFRGDIPGGIAWDRGAYSYNSEISIRGADVRVKTYLDGVEIAEPSYIATLDPSSIERIEVLRGPQASTIYGSQALAGVIQIFTKRGAFNTAHPELEAKISSGLIESRWNSRVQQDHSVAVSGGGADFSYRLDGGWLHNGDWIPEAHSSGASFNGSLRAIQGPVTLDLSARYYGKSGGDPNDPDLAIYPYFSKPSYEMQDLRQQTYGVSVKYAATPRWQHSLVLGYDRSGDDVYLTQPRFTTPADSLLYVVSTDFTKASVAYNTSYEVALGGAAQGSVTAGVDHWTFHSGGFYAGATPVNNNQIQSPDFGLRYQYDNWGYFAQTQVGFSNDLFVTAGLRAEDNQNFGHDFGLAWAPRVGVSYVRALGDVTAKVRAAYGKAIVPPPPGAAQTIVYSGYKQQGNPSLGPEQQVGPDGGVELYFGQRGSLDATYYRQTWKDRIDNVVLATSPVYTYQVQNVGQVRNRGWEFRGHLNAGRLSVTGTYSITNSVVEKLSPTYRGDLRPGDESLRIPKYASGATLSYSLPRTAVTLGITHFGSWIETDWIALLGYYYGGQPYRGSGRAYWITYPAFTKVNLSMTQTVANRLSVFLRSDNLTNNNAWELYNNWAHTGRVTMIGVRTRF